MSRDYSPTKPQLRQGLTSSSQAQYSSPDKRQLNCVPGAPLVKYVLSAEFDVKIGAVVKHQVPRKIPGFKEHLGTLGELMIPSSSEHNENSYSVFILYKDSSGMYRLLPDSDVDMVEEGVFGLQRMNINEMSTIFEKTTHDDDTLFFFTVTRSVESTKNERGRVIKSISVGTPLRNFVIFKHLITLTIDLYINDGNLSHLVSLFNVINSTDVSMWRSYITANSHLYNLLSLDYDFNNRIFLTHFKNMKTKDVNTKQPVKYKNGVLQYFPQYDVSASPEHAVMSKIPLNLPLNIHPTDITTDLKLTNLILKFLHELSSQLNRINYRNLNIVIYSSENVDVLSAFIMVLSNFLNGFNKTYFHNDRILYFPLIDLYNWEKVLDYNTQTKNTKIIGTNNIILKENTEFYDFFYDLDTSSIGLSERLETLDHPLEKTHDFLELTDTLLQQQHDYNTVRVSLQRFNLWEIIRILKRSDTDQSEVNLKDYYLSRNKNVVLFDEFFEYKTIQLIEVINELVQLLITPFSSLTSVDIDVLKRCYDFIYSYISSTTVKGRIEMFLYLLEIFPTNIKSPSDLIFDSEHSLIDQRLISDVFKPLLYGDVQIQRRVAKVYSVLSKSMLRVVLEQRLDLFVMTMLEEYKSRNKIKTEALHTS
ncbi:CYFA0S01e09956g1_1 [Cyberlindnera fabianii]|uniref:CYFA0S01e09956g1_1 n=1 Tax=Cyberlindnera fabianii TaxID=36022 RepID=A0A061APR5_CYBFA|nr:CYFA0S01e09956g1_1 [Cyberlindnera fabianii]